MQHFILASPKVTSRTRSPRRSCSRGSIVLSLLLFAVIVFTLAYSRVIGARLHSLFAQIRPAVYTPLSSLPWGGSSNSNSNTRPLSDSTMASSKYRSPPQEPPLFTATATSLVDDAKKLCEKSRRLLDDIVAHVTPETATFANTVLPMTQDEDENALQARIIGFYQAVSTDAALRDASSKADEIMDEFGIEAAMREDVFRLVDAAWQKAKKGEEVLDGESLRLLEKERKGYLHYGLGIEKGPKRDRYKEIRKRLSVVCDCSLLFPRWGQGGDGGLTVRADRNRVSEASQRGKRRHLVYGEGAGGCPEGCPGRL